MFTALNKALFIPREREGEEEKEGGGRERERERERYACIVGVHLAIATTMKMIEA